MRLRFFVYFKSIAFHFFDRISLQSGVAVSSFVSAKAVTASDWNASRSAVLTAYADGAVGLWDTRSGAGEQRRFRSHTGWVSSVAFRGDAPLFVTGSYDNTVKLWDLRSNIPLYTIGNAADVSSDKVFAVAWGNGERDILSGGTEKRMKIFDASDS